MKNTTKILAAAVWLIACNLARAEAQTAAAALPPAAAAEQELYVDPQSSAAAWARNNPGDSRAADIARHIGSQASARWFGGWSGDIANAVGRHVSAAAQAHRTPVMVAYNIPGRDCGQYSAGGERSARGYQDWAHAFAQAIGDRPAIVILEPDALPQLDCLKTQEKAERVQLIQFAVQAFHDLAPRTLLYIDIGNSDWLPPAEAAKRLLQAGVESAQGFSLNVSNYRGDSESKAYGIAVAQALQSMGGLSKSFVVDTSRNGAGPDGKQWCDAVGRKLGQLPRVHGIGSQPEMSLWVKGPGEADGCAGPAGKFMPEIAYQLIGGR